MKKDFLRSLGFFGVILFLSSVLRAYFFIIARGQFSNESFSNILIGFIHGVRFDVSALLYVNVLFLLLLYFEVIRKSKIAALIFSIFNGVYCGMLIADVDFYLSYGKKVDLNFFTAVEGTGAKTLFIMFGVYKHVFIMMGFAFILFYSLYRFWWKNISVQNSIKKYPLYLLLVLLFSFLGIRGGVQKRVLGRQHAMLYANGSSVVTHLTSNTVHNLIRGKNKKNFPNRYMPGEIQKKDLSRFEFRDLNLKKRPKNVLFVFIESLSSYAVKKDGLLKEIRKDFKKDAIYTPNLYANGRLSLDAITASFFGAPSHFGIHLFNSKYSQNKWVGLSTVLQKKGFDGFFIDAATKGTQFFDIITEASGINDFYSVVDRYDVPSDMEAKWGVHDDFLYEKTKTIVKNYKKPFVGALFTTSSHTPFIGTPNNKSGLGNIEKDYFLSIKYADSALERFFKSIKNEPWYNDTLFLIMGDHSPPVLADWNMSLEYDSRLPLLMYLPGSNLSSVEHRKESQHIDLPMTIFHLLGVKPEVWSPFGYSMFDMKIKTPVFYTGSGKRKLNIVLPGDKRRSSDFKGFQSLEFQKVEKEIKNYVYRLENDSFYKK